LNFAFCHLPFEIVFPCDRGEVQNGKESTKYGQS
jgi:hypothetical protein